MEQEFKIIPRKNPEQANAALLKALRDLWTEYLQCREAFQKKVTIGSVHHLRTSVRKLEAMLDLLKVLGPGQSAKPLFKQIDRELKSLSELRDAQVQKRKLHIERVDWLRNKKFLRHLNAIEKTEASRAMHKIKARGKPALEYQKIERATAEFFAKSTRQDAQVRLEELRRHFARHRLELQRQYSTLAPKQDKGFHRLRIDVKKCLYQIEIAAAVIEAPPILKSKIAKLKKDLGELQDRVALAENARGFYKKSKNHPHPKKVLRRMILKQQTELIRARMI